ncbi:hypothetical protein SAMN05216273_10340 [Chryseobacterium taihuense]|uniref:Uncharacterized protein n=1 Tax=Chryseobacterium taihuense TaxID=1141221 RepID=A0ABY0QR22_9FLAO|nr:hypothetical protein SAMN05216273_10340 [Chryseobacterium taihuense]
MYKNFLQCKNIAHLPPYFASSNNETGTANDSQPDLNGALFIRRNDE